MTEQMLQLQMAQCRYMLWHVVLILCQQRLHAAPVSCSSWGPVIINLAVLILVLATEGFMPVPV